MGLLYLYLLPIMQKERGSPVSIATRYGLDGPRIESRWGGGRDFPHPSRPALGPTQPPIQWVLAVKRPGRGVDHPPHLVPRLKEQKSYTSAPLLGLRGLLKGELNLYFYPSCRRLGEPHGRCGDGIRFRIAQPVARPYAYYAIAAKTPCCIFIQSSL